MSINLKLLSREIIFTNPNNPKKATYSKRELKFLKTHPPAPRRQASGQDKVLPSLIT